MRFSTVLISAILIFNTGRIHNACGFELEEKQAKINEIEQKINMLGRILKQTEEEKNLMIRRGIKGEILNRVESRASNLREQILALERNREDSEKNNSVFRNNKSLEIKRREELDELLLEKRKQIQLAEKEFAETETAKKLLKREGTPISVFEEMNQRTKEILERLFVLKQEINELEEQKRFLE